MGRQEIQNESHESSESSYFPSSSCYPCVPHPWPASVQRRSILLLQQQWQLCQQSQGFNSCGRRKRQANFGGAVLLAHRKRLHLQQWQEAEASTWRGPAWNKVLWRPLWWHPSLWQLLLQQPAFQQQRFQQQLPEPGRIQQPGFQQPGLQPEPGFQQPKQPSLPMRLQPNVPGPEREHPRCVPAQGQHREDVVLHHRLEQQLWRPADLEEVSKQPLVLHGLQQSRTMRNVNCAII